MPRFSLCFMIVFATLVTLVTTTRAVAQERFLTPSEAACIQKGLNNAGPLGADMNAAANVINEFAGNARMAVTQAFSPIDLTRGQAALLQANGNMIVRQSDGQRENTIGLTGTGGVQIESTVATPAGLYGVVAMHDGSGGADIYAGTARDTAEQCEQMPKSREACWTVQYKGKADPAMTGQIRQLLINCVTR